MFEFIIVIALLVILPYLFHVWITSKYHAQDKLFFGDDYMGDIEDEDTLNDIGKGDNK